MFGLRSGFCFALLLTLAASVEAGHRKPKAACCGGSYGTSAGYGYGYGYNYAGSSYYGGYQNWGTPGYGMNGWNAAYQFGGYGPQQSHFGGGYGPGPFQTGPVVPPVAPGDELVF